MHNNLKNQNVTWQSVSKTWLSSMRSHPLHPCLSDPNIYTVAFMEKFCTTSQLMFCEVTYWEICETGSSDSCWSCSYLRCSTSATSAFIKHLAFTKSAHSHRRKNGKFISQTQPQSEGIYLFYQQKWHSLPLKQKKRKNLLRVSRHKLQNAVYYRAWNKTPKKKKVPPTFTELEFTSILLLHHWR